MINIKNLSSILFVGYIIVSSLFFTGCFSDDDSKNDSAAVINEVSSPYLICQNRNPGGVGIDLDTGKAYNIDDNPPFDWDIRVKTYKGVQSSSGEPVASGAPFIKLKGTIATAVTWTSAGQDNYNNIVLSDISGLIYTADGFEEIDLTAVDTVLETDGFTQAQLESGNCAVGNYYYNWTGKNGLKQEYAKCAIGENWKSVAANIIHTDDKIYIVKSDQGSYFKLMVPNFGPNSDIGESGYIELVWQKLQ